MKKEDRNIYIENMDADYAKIKYYEKLSNSFIVQPEQIKVLDSLGRVTYEAVYAENSSPHYNSAAMDGILVRANNTIGASEVSPKILVENEDFEYVNTGNPVTGDYDAVIMIEDVIELGDGKVNILNAAYPWQHIRPIGEDIVATEMIIPSRHKIRPIDLGALLIGGIEKIRVYKKPSVGIIPTGSEIIEDNSKLTEGKILDSNSRVFEGLVKEYGGIPNRYSPIEDIYNTLKSVIIKAISENDILLINAGSSAGTKDYSVKLIRELGEVVVHGVALKPGKPTILGIINEKPVIGIPGYPVSSYLVFETFVKPIIYKYSGIKNIIEQKVKATISKRVVSSLKNKELVRVTLGNVNNKLVATPLSGGAGVTMSLVKADGIAIIPQNSEGIEAGEEVDVSLLKPLSNIRETLVSIGSHDMIMDIIADMMSLSSGHVGSMGGILAMKRNECHLSPIHLLDPQSGEYNVGYVRKYFPGNKMAIIKGVRRLQGFMVMKGNPKSIRNFNDLIREDVTYVNRQRGAGTRVLLDYNLNKYNINVLAIKGYERELTTHMAVATAVKTGSATVGLGIYSAAKALGLDFVNVGYEDYDFLVPLDSLNDEKIIRFIEVITSTEFKEKVMSMGGYEFTKTGNIILSN